MIYSSLFRPTMKMPQPLPVPQSYVICPAQKKDYLSYIDDKRPSATDTQKTLQVIQRASFGNFIKNLSEDDKSEDLILYTYVLADGGGDQGMLQNLSGIFNKYKTRLGYKNQKLYAVYAPGFKGNQTIKHHVTGKHEYPDESRTLLPVKGTNNHEL